ncbi:heavy metal sensor histidine kinase [Halomonas organivorans]|uniref:Sensor protein n=1 Tax=Halomonas organivorans TaxID=257772 RepID=A0A7W5G6E8_9GAMM|nr:heavy metal sensor histidine kinase [Halomonas organivorans]MBB3141411.1 two-component system heavy metal sensor histidine kinase CusS [Halomonas organivorans]
MRGPSSLSLRLSLLFALVTLVLLGGLGAYLYHALGEQIAWRDDQMLQGRLERMEALLDDGESIAALRRRPLLYANMLGNRESLLWILDAQGTPLIEVNPPGLPVPELPSAPEGRLGEHPAVEATRLAWRSLDHDGRRLTLVAGKTLDERERMLAAYRLRLWLAMGVGAVLACVLGWAVARRGLRPVRRLADRARMIDVAHLHQRLEASDETTELRELSRALNQMLARLEEGFAQLSRFSEDLAHEMRTPLGNLLGATQQALQRERASEEYRQLLGSHVEEYERLSRMIETMLFLARTEQPSQTLPREVLDLGTLVDQLCDYFEGMAEDDGRSLVNRTQGRVTANLDLLRRALANLIDNALRHGGSGTEIRLVSRPEAGRLRLGVISHGAPIHDAERERLFERFYRGDPARSRPAGTGGLGLAIVRSVAQLHGGEAWCESDAAATVFWLSLPADGGGRD